jgi:chromosome partitioning protein
MPEEARTATEGLGLTNRPVPALGAPGPRTTSGPADIIALCNQKGGVGKTTTAINLGAALAEFGRRVLLVDFDPQGALGAGVGVHPQSLEHTIYDVMITGEVTAAEVIHSTSVPGMDLMPANIDLSGAELLLVSEVGREQSLMRALRPIRNEYDVIIIDCQPSLGLLTVNALTASRWVIIPVECEYFSLRGVALLQDTVARIQERTNPDLEVLGVLATMFDRTLHAREVLGRLVEAFDDRVFHTVITRTVKFPETSVAGVPIMAYAPTSAAAKAYRTLAVEVLARIDPESIGEADPESSPGDDPGSEQLALG